LPAQTAWRIEGRYSFFWDSFQKEEAIAPLLNPYGEVLTGGERILEPEEIPQNDRKISELGLDLAVREGNKNAFIPLWEVFGNLNIDEADFLWFANKFGRLGPRKMITRKDPKRSGGKGSVIRIGRVVDTFEFWKREVALFNTMLKIDNAIQTKNIKQLGTMLEARKDLKKQNYFSLLHEYQGEKTRGSIHHEHEERAWEAAGGNGPTDLIKIGKVFLLQALQGGLAKFPTQMGITFGVNFQGDRSKDLSRMPYTLFYSSCLLGALYMSFSLKFTEYVKYHICAECECWGEENDMVHRHNGDWIHEAEYNTRLKREYRKRKQEKEKASGAKIRKRGRPRKNTESL
jgi:hypothetical protein